MNSATIKGLSAGLIAASIWGGMYVVSKVILDVVPPFTLLSVRLALGALSLWVATRFMPPTTLTKKQVGQSVAVGLLGYGISLGFQFVGTKLSTALNSALVTSATPAFVLFFAPFLLGEKINTRRLAALTVASLGVLAVIDLRSADFSSAQFRGNLALLAAGLTWALYSVLVRKISSGGHLLLSGVFMLLGGLPSSLLFSVWEMHSQTVGVISIGVIAGILYLGIISTAVAMFLWNYSFAVLPAATASLTFFAQPLVGAVLGALVLDEKITPLFMLGGVMIAIGLVIASTENSAMQNN